MKQLGIITCALVLGTSACCHADQIGSYATGAFANGNSNTAMNFAGMSSTNTISGGTAPTFTLNPNGVWELPPAFSTWVGYAPTAGPLSGVNPPGTIGAPEYYTFTTTFSPTGNWTGSINVEADDTTEVFLNGVEQVGDGALGSDSLCAVAVPNCTRSDLIAIAGGAGPNTLTFVVEQAGFGAGTDDPSGLAFGGDITVVPEPSAFMLLGTGLVFMGRVIKARKFSNF